MRCEMGNGRVRVLVVEDSNVMGKQVARILSEHEQIEVVGRARDGVEALRLVQELEPDVVTLDVMMPHMDGITTLKHLMLKHPVPTVVISAKTSGPPSTIFDAIRYGAIDVVPKPCNGESGNLATQRREITSRVIRAAAIGTGRCRYTRLGEARISGRGRSGLSPDPSTHMFVLGAGTGGYCSLLRIVPSLPDDFEDIVIAILLVPPRNIEMFASYMGHHSAIPVESVLESTPLETGTCYVCSGSDGVVVGPDASGKLRFVLDVEPAEIEDQGPVDRMFRSCAHAFGDRTVGVVMTGAGSDGAEGVAAVQQLGGVAAVQTVANCIDPSMPQTVLDRCPVDKMVPDYEMASFFAGCRS